MLPYVIRRPVSKVEWGLLLVIPFGIAGQFFAPRGLSHAENVLGLVATVLGAVLWIGLGKVRIDEQRRYETLRVPVDIKIEMLESSLQGLRSSMEQIRAIVPDLEEELELRTATIEKLKAEAEGLNRLSEIRHIETRAIEELIDRTVRTGQTLGQYATAGKEKLYFLAGLVLSVPIGLMVNFAYDKWVK